MASIVNQWTATTGDRDNEIPVTPTDGNWLFAAVGLHKVDGRQSSISVGDLHRNLWYLVGHAENESSGLITELWACPNIKTYGQGTNVYVATSFLIAYDIGSVPTTVFEVSGMGNGFYTLGSVVSGVASGTTGITLSPPDPSEDSLILSSVVCDVNFGAVDTTGAGWTALSTEIDANPNVGLAPALTQGTTPSDITVSLQSGTGNWAGLVASIRKTGEAPSVPPDWGESVNMEVQAALGYDQSTPTSAVHWKTLSEYCQSVHTSRGITEELGTVQSGSGTIEWINDYGQFTPRDPANAVVVSSGSVNTALISDSESGGFEVGDFFRLETYDGVLLEDTVFEVTGKSSSGGVTTLAFDPDAKTAPAIGDVVAGTPLDIFTPVRVLATVDGKKYPIMVGASEAVPQTWLDGEHGRVEMTTADAYGTLSATVPNVLHGQILASNPYAFWSLGDAQDATTAANESTRSTTELSLSKSKFGTGTDGAATFGAGLQNIPRDNTEDFGTTSAIGAGSGTGWQQTGLASGDNTVGYALVGRDDNLPSIANGITIMGVSNLEINQPSQDGTLVIIRNNDPSAGNGEGSIIKVCKQAGSNDAKIVWWDKDTHIRTEVSTSIVLANAGLAIWFLQLLPNAWLLSVNGHTESNGADLVSSWNQLDIGGEADEFWNGHCVNGTHGFVAVFDRLLTAGEMNLLQRASGLGMSSYTAIDGTMLRQLSFVGWPGARILSHSDVLTSEDVGLEGSSVGDVVSQMSLWEDGLLWVDAAGYLQYRSRNLLDKVSEKFTLGPDASSGEIPYLGAPQYDADGKLLFTEIDVDNTAHVGRFIGGSIAAERTGTSSAYHPNTSKYGVRPRTVSTHLYNIGDAVALSEWLVNRYGVRRLRIRQIQVDPRAASGTNGWHAVFGAEVGDLVRVKWSPGNAPALSDRCIILHIEHDADPGRWLTTFTLMVAPDPGVLLDDDTQGVIGEGTLTL